MALDFLSPLHKATRQISLHLQESGDAGGMEPGEAHLLTYLLGYGPCTVGKLHRVFGFKPSTLTSMLDRLERRGLLMRSANPDDRRSFLVDATDGGRETAAAIRARLEDFEARVRSRVAPEDLAGFRRVMKAIEETTKVKFDNPEERT